jgi:dihydroorotate dehydrogenase
MSLYPIFRDILFQLDPEVVHGLTLRLIRLSGQLPPVRSILNAWFSTDDKPVDLFGIHFRNPIGLAAGYDKDGLGWQGLASLGFGHVEVGTVTLEPQEGNPRPRLFRLVKEKALINRMGFPGKGAHFAARQLHGRHPNGVVLGVNIGKNKNTPNEEAARDYLALQEIFTPLADYLAINVSSPNTVGLRRLQARDQLEALLGELAQKRAHMVEHGSPRIPILVKLAPDLSDAELEDALTAIANTGMDGVIVSNTTISREGLELGSEEHLTTARQTGGLSGAPLSRRSTEMIRTVHRLSNGKMPIVGVGGVMDYAGAREKLDAGASLVQVYTGMVYAGPGLVKEIVSRL